MKSITENLSCFGEKEHLKYDCVAFETLGSEDFAFMVFADRIEDFAKLLTVLRKQQFSDNKTLLFSNICAMMGFNKKYYSYKPEMEVIVKISAKKAEYKTAISREISKHAADNIKIYSIMQGVDVFEAHFKPTDLELWHGLKAKNELYKIGGVLNGETDIYKKYISSSRTFWLINKSDKLEDDAECIGVHNPFGDIDKKDSGEENSIITKKSSDKNHVFSFIISEYNRLIQLNQCAEWRNILRTQRDSLLNFDSFFDETGKERRELTDGMQAVLTHINQACTPVYEIPYHNYFYSGSFDDILKMYYGIIHFIKKKGWEIRREPENEPTDFSFGIRFDSVENIQTRSFSSKQQEYRFVIFQLPYSALYDFNTSAKLLVHEVFHYIAPVNRKYRNKQMLNIWMTYLLMQMEKQMRSMRNCSNDIWDKDIASWIKGILDDAQVCSEYLEEFYKAITKESYYPKFDIYEMSVFGNLSFAEDILTKFCQFISVKLHDFDAQKWRILTDKAKQLSCIDPSVHNPSDVDAWYALQLWLRTTDPLRGMIELASTVKEVFCDLFMCALYKLDFKQYLELLTLYKAKERLTMAVDDMSLSYRIRMVASVLRAGYEYDPKKIVPAVPRSEIDLIVQIMKVDTADPWFEAFLRKNDLAGQSPTIHKTIIDTLRYEIEYLHDYSEQFGLFKEFSVREYLAINEEKDEFLYHLKMMNAFMNYDEIPIVSTCTLPHYSCSRVDEESRTSFVPSLGEYIAKMAEISDATGRQLWFRGVCNNTHGLTPSLLRNVSSDFPLYAAQVKSLKTAYDATIQYPDLWSDKIQEQISLLQHYGVPTNLLDFSLDMLTAMHFALTPDYSKDKENLQKGLITPAVYAFDPIEYAHAVDSLKQQKITSEQFSVSPVLYELADDNMSYYFPYRMDEAFLKEQITEFQNAFSPHETSILYPVPVIIRHSHERIRVQGGTFVAFDLRSKPDMNDHKHPYAYLDLKKFEKAYEKLQDDQKVPKSQIRKFLYEIDIDCSAVLSIQNEIRALRISKASVYPELSNIFNDAAEGLFPKKK